MSFLKQQIIQKGYLKNQSQKRQLNSISQIGVEPTPKKRRYNYKQIVNPFERKYVTPFLKLMNDEDEDEDDKINKRKVQQQPRLENIPNGIDKELLETKENLKRFRAKRLNRLSNNTTTEPAPWLQQDQVKTTNPLRITVTPYIPVNTTANTTTSKDDDDDYDDDETDKKVDETDKKVGEIVDENVKKNDEEKDDKPVIELTIAPPKNKLERLQEKYNRVIDELSKTSSLDSLNYKALLDKATKLAGKISKYKTQQTVDISPKDIETDAIDYNPEEKLTEIRRKFYDLSLQQYDATKKKDDKNVLKLQKEREELQKKADDLIKTIKSKLSKEKGLRLRKEIDEMNMFEEKLNDGKFQLARLTIEGNLSHRLAHYRMNLGSKVTITDLPFDIQEKYYKDLTELYSNRLKELRNKVLNTRRYILEAIDEGENISQYIVEKDKILSGEIAYILDKISELTAAKKSMDERKRIEEERKRIEEENMEKEKRESREKQYLQNKIKRKKMEEKLLYLYRELSREQHEYETIPVFALSWPPQQRHEYENTMIEQGKETKRRIEKCEKNLQQLMSKPDFKAMKDAISTISNTEHPDNSSIRHQLEKLKKEISDLEDKIPLYTSNTFLGKIAMLPYRKILDKLTKERDEKVKRADELAVKLKSRKLRREIFDQKIAEHH